MQVSTKILFEERLNDWVLTDIQLGRLISDFSWRCYNLVNRAMKPGELIWIGSGLYILLDKYRSMPCYLYAPAQGLVPGSYV